MIFKPLQVTAFLACGIAVYEDWSPQLEGLLIRKILEAKHLASSNPSLESARANMAAIANEIPLDKWEGLYRCSAPVYRYKSEETTKFRKRWEPDGRIAWGKRKAKFDTAQGAEKSYDLPLFIRLTPRIDWFAVGDRVQIENLLDGVTCLGKKRSHGYGQVVRWEVKEIEEDWSLVRDGFLMRAVPADLFQKLDFVLSHKIMEWGHTPPVWLPENKALCAMPDVVRHDG